MGACNKMTFFKILLLLCFLGTTSCAQNAYNVRDTAQKEQNTGSPGTKMDKSLDLVAKVDAKTPEQKPVLTSAIPKNDVAAEKAGKTNSQGLNSQTTVVEEDVSPKSENTPAKDVTTVPIEPNKKVDSSGQSNVPDAKNEKKKINALNVTGEGVEIIADSGISNFKSFRLTKPQRLVIDVFDATTSIVGNVVPINRFGVRSARLGIHPDKVRFVFEASGKSFPQYKIETSGKSLMVIFAGLGKEQKIQEARKSNDETGAQQITPASSKSKNLAVESIDFKIVNGYSRITIRANEVLNIDKPSKTTEGIVLTAKNCILPKKLQRPFDTKAFESSVVKVTPYQVRTQSGYDTKVVIKLRQDAPYEVKSEGNIVLVDVKNQEISGSVPPAPVTQHTPPVTSIRIPGPGSMEAEHTQSPSGKKIYTGRRVTLEFADADIRKIFQLIAEVSNLNFLLGDDVTGTISIKLVNVPWDQALDVILETKGLGMKREGNIVVIRPLGKIQTLADEQQAEKRALEKGMELKTKVFDINYAAVPDIATQFNAVKSERGLIAPDARTNRVIVTDIEPAIEKMTALLKALDIPERQVMIEARIVEATSTFTRDLGIQWGIHTRDGTDVDAGWGGILTGTAPTDVGSTFGPGAAASISFGKLIANGTLDLKLSAAASTGQVKIISTPKVVTLNNKAAKIAQGQSIPYQTVSAEGTKTEFVEAALTLEVTPHITADGSVSMKIKASNNSAGAAPAGTPPPINKKEATTELLVKNGETTVIGGIYVDNDSESEDGVPFLKDVPLLGWLFKSNNKFKSKSELLIFITPKIVS